MKCHFNCHLINNILSHIHWNKMGTEEGGQNEEFDSVLKIGRFNRMWENFISFFVIINFATRWDPAMNKPAYLYESIGVINWIQCNTASRKRNIFQRVEDFVDPPALLIFIDADEGSVKSAWSCVRSLRCVNSDRLLDNQLVDAINSGERWSNRKIEREEGTKSEAWSN